jgi:hypothetical protein
VVSRGCAASICASSAAAIGSWLSGVPG